MKKYESDDYTDDNFEYTEEELEQSAAEGKAAKAEEAAEVAETEEETEAEEAEMTEAEEETEAEEAEVTEAEEVSEEEPEYEDDGYDEDDEEEDEETYRRRVRRQRRVRNQIISYTVTLLILTIICTGLYFLISFGMNKLNEYKQSKMPVETEEPVEEITVEAPESVVDESPAENLDDYVEDDVIDDIDYLGEAVSATIGQMTIEDKVAQLFITTPEALTGVDVATRAGDGTRAALEKYAVGGLIYSSKNIEDADQLTELLSNTVNMSKYELFLGIKEAGGDGSTLANSKINEIPSVESPSDIAATGDSNNAYNAGVTIASYMSSYGFNLNVSPDGSIITEDDSVAAQTGYGSEDSVVYDMASKMIEGLKSGDVLSCMTGFPGLGNITEDTSKDVVKSEISADELNAQIVPYISGIAAGANLIMLNNVTYVTADTTGEPASLSSYIIGDLLRNNMGFQGVIITDSLSEKAIADSYAIGDAVVAAIKAGADMVYVPDNFEEAYSGLLDAVTNGTISEERLNESLERILRVKLADNID